MYGPQMRTCSVGGGQVSVPVLTVDRRGSVLPVFRLYVPLSRGLNEQVTADESWFSKYIARPIGEAYGGHLTFEAAGDATLRLWAGAAAPGTPSRSNVETHLRTLAEVRFEPFALGPWDQRRRCGPRRWRRSDDSAQYRNAGASHR